MYLMIHTHSFNYLKTKNFETDICVLFVNCDLTGRVGKKLSSRSKIQFLFGHLINIYVCKPLKVVLENTYCINKNSETTNTKTKLMKKVWNGLIILRSNKQ